MASLQMPLGSSMGRLWIEDETIAEARNALCTAALDQNVDYLFFLSDDVLPPPNALLSLLDKIGRIFHVEERDTKAELITGVYWTKAYPPEPYLFKDLLKGTFKDWKAGEFLPVDMAGCDCLMISTEVLRTVPFPWFSTDWVWEEGQKPSPIATEDFYFFTKARQHGFKLFADTSIQCLHEDRGTGAMFGLSMEMVQAGGTPEVGEDEVLVADVGAGLSTLSSLFGPKAKIVRFDMREDVKPDYRVDIRNIPEHHFGKYDYVHASHVLEHFRRSEAPNLVKHWAQLLKVGGKLLIRVPNFEHAVGVIATPLYEEFKGHPVTPPDKNYAWAQIYGDQAQEGAPWQHLNGFTSRKLESLLGTVPALENVVVEEEDEGLNLKATSVKGSEGQLPVLVDMWEKGSLVG